MFRLAATLLALLASLLLVLVVVSAPAKAQTCGRLEAIECVRSPDCMYQKTAESGQYACVTPSNRCQIGFPQAVARNSDISVSEICKARTGCHYVPAGECYCPPDVDCVCGGGTPPDCVVDTGANLTPPNGRYVIVTIRNASDVAVPLDEGARNEIINQAFTFTPEEVFTGDLGCDNWAVKSVDTGINFLDPMLADVLIGPMGSSGSVVDNRILDHWRYSCEGEHFMTLTRIDRRVLVILWNNSAQYLIAEKPLAQGAVKRLQTELKSMKFYDGGITGRLDEATLTALGFLVKYRLHPKEVYRFGRTTISENLLSAP